MEYLSTSISAILAARRSTLAPKGGRDYRTKWLPGLGIEFEYPMQWKYESETTNMDTRKILSTAKRLTFLQRVFSRFCSFSKLWFCGTNRDGNYDWSSEPENDFLESSKTIRMLGLS